MKRLFPLIKIISVVAIAVLADSCKKNPSGPSVEPRQVSGAVQKGPFITGTSVTIHPLDAQLAPTGESYETQISDDLGNFMFPVKISAPYAELTAQGYYFNEILGRLSDSPITLRSIIKLNDGDHNINLLTTLEAGRLLHLVTQEHKSFEEARKTAQAEVLASFGITLNDELPSDRMNISKAGQANAILLAVSTIMQSYRSEAELSELIAKTANDIRNNGRITQPALQAAVRDGHTSADPEWVRRNLIRRYEQIGTPGVHIPDFYSYVDSDGDGKLNGAEPYILLENDKVTLLGRGDTADVSIHTNIEWESVISVDAADWLFVDPKTTEDLLVLRATPNNGAARRGQIILKGKNSTLADTLDILQAGNTIRLRLNLEAGWKSKSISKTIDPELDGLIDNLTVIGFSPLSGKIMFKHQILTVTDEALEFSVPYEDLSESGNIMPLAFFYVIANDADNYRDFQGSNEDFTEYRTTQDLNEITGPLPMLGVGNLGPVSFTDVNEIPVTFSQTAAQISFQVEFSSEAFATEPEILSVTATGINSQRGRLYPHPGEIDTAYRNDYTMTKPAANGKYTFYNYDRASIEQVIFKVKANGIDYTYALIMRQTNNPTQPIIFMGGYSYNYRIRINKASISSTLQ